MNYRRYQTDQSTEDALASTAAFSEVGMSTNGFLDPSALMNKKPSELQSNHAPPLRSLVAANATPSSILRPVEVKKVTPPPAPVFSEAELKYFKRMFDIFDTSHRGSLGFYEVKSMCRHLGVVVEDEELRISIDEIDDNGNGLLEFDEFITWLASMGGGGGGGDLASSVGSSSSANGTYGSRSGADSWGILKSKIRARGANPISNAQIDSFHEVFNHFDVSQTGTINREELRGVYRAMGQEDVSDDEIDDLMAEVDTDRSGEIDFDEFLLLMCMGFGKAGGMGDDGTQSIEAHIREAFSAVDVDHTDFISPDELCIVIANLTKGELTAAEIKDIVSGAPRDTHNRISYSQWQCLWDSCGSAAT